jgi:TetR/AcrR family transcriptional regulator, transcriptional repressor for nem operon
MIAQEPIPFAPMPRPREFREGEVLRAVRDRFWRDGYEATSIADIASATGLRAQSLYGAFGNKHELFIRVLRGYCDRQLAGLERSIAAAPSPWEAVVQVALYEDPGRLALRPWGCLLARSTWELGRHDAEVRELAAHTYATTIDAFERCIHEAQESGEIASTRSAGEIARAAFTISQGVIAMRTAAPDDAQFAEAKHASEAMLRALAAQ